MSAFRIVVGATRETPARYVVLAVRGIVVATGECITETVATYATAAEADDVCVRLAMAYQCPAGPIGALLARSDAPALEAAK